MYAGRLVVVVVALFVSVLTTYATSTDSLQTHNSVYVVPFASYQPETNVAGGFGYGYYLKSESLSKISSVTGGVTYTQRNQFIVSLTPRLYLPNGWYMYSSVNFRKYPDYFYGVGNGNRQLRQAFTSNSYSVLLQPQYGVSANWMLGAVFGFRYESSVRNKDIVSEFSENNGWKPYTLLNSGFVLAFDSRDNSFYPYKGTFVKLTGSLSCRNLGSSYSMADFAIDTRRYVSLSTGAVIALQLSGQYVVGNVNQLPFQIMPTYGGIDQMRGVIRGVYRDRCMLVQQSELRVHLYKKLKAAVFCSGANVFNDRFDVAKVHFAYGAGLRYALNDARVHLRCDLAQSCCNGSLQFYITASEAF